MTAEEIASAQSEVARIDAFFDGATGWGSWMVMTANRREAIVNRLRAAGVDIEHKWLARCGGRRID